MSCKVCKQPRLIDTAYGLVIRSLGNVDKAIFLLTWSGGAAWQVGPGEVSRAAGPFACGDTAWRSPAATRACAHILTRCAGGIQEEHAQPLDATWLG